MHMNIVGLQYSVLKKFIINRPLHAGLWRLIQILWWGRQPILSDIFQLNEVHSQQCKRDNPVELGLILTMAAMTSQGGDGQLSARLQARMKTLFYILSHLWEMAIVNSFLFLGIQTKVCIQEQEVQLISSHQLLMGDGSVHVTRKFESQHCFNHLTWKTKRWICNARHHPQTYKQQIASKAKYVDKIRYRASKCCNDHICLKTSMWYSWKQC